MVGVVNVNIWIGAFQLKKNQSACFKAESYAAIKNVHKNTNGIREKMSGKMDGAYACTIIRFSETQVTMLKGMLSANCPMNDKILRKNEFPQIPTGRAEGGTGFR